MRAVDTNVIVRYLTNDDPKQAAKARALIGHEPIFVPRTVLLEVEWVLRSVYNFSTRQVMPILRAFAGLPGIMIEDAFLVAKAIDWTEAGVDFADALHLAASTSCNSFFTFDKRFSRSATRLGGSLVTVL